MFHATFSSSTTSPEMKHNTTHPLLILKLFCNDSFNRRLVLS